MPLISAGLHPEYVRSDQLSDEITELFGFITAATYDLLVKIREFDQDGLWRHTGVCSCAHWLNWKCGIGMNAAREKVRVANALGCLPKISKAFRLGEISYSKVRAITRVCRPESEDYLLMIARHGTASHVESLIRGYRYARKLHDRRIAAKQINSRSMSYRWAEDGSLVFYGLLPAEVGAMLVKAIDSAVDHADRPNEVTDKTWEPIEARRADALAQMAERYLEKGPAASSSADRYQVMIHVSAETLAADSTDKSGVSAETSLHPEDEISHIENGPYVTAETSRRICCDSSISRMIEDGEGEPISIGRKSRVIPPTMRRALKARDKNCRFPGCTHQHFIDGHHIKHWADGGETSVDNLVLLCRYHHRLVHEGGFGCEKKENGEIVFIDRLGDVIEESGYQPPRRDNVIIDLKARLEDRFIHSETCVPKMDSATMDRHLAVSHLWDKHHPME